MAVLYCNLMEGRISFSSPSLGFKVTRTCYKLMSCNEGARQTTEEGQDRALR